MNKGQQFWVDMWQAGRTSFHKQEVNSDLIAYWPVLNLQPNATVLVPLCGKSLDMLWLINNGFKVIGIELSIDAINQFAAEQQINLQQEHIGVTPHYFSERLSLWRADIFALDPTLISEVDAIYDRAALIALPKKLRAAYVEKCLQWLKPQGSVLLKTLSYDSMDMSGPPYSVTAEEVMDLYTKCFKIQCLRTAENPRDQSDPLHGRGLVTATDSVWCIRKSK